MTTTTKQAAREAEAIMRGERLLPAAAVRARWNITHRQLLKRVNQGHPCGQRLVAVWVNPREPQFRLADVVAFEEACARYDRSRGR